MSAMKKFSSKKLLYMSEDHGLRGNQSFLRFISDTHTRVLRDIYGAAPVGLLSLEIGNFYSLASADEADFGKDVMDSLEYEAAELLASLLPGADPMFVERVGLCNVVFFLQLPAADLTALATAGFRLQTTLRDHLNFKLLRSTKGFLEVRVGHSLVDGSASGDFAEVFYKAYCQSRRIAANPISAEALPLIEEFKSILDTGDVTMLYQPIVEFDQGAIIGWEAFARGPEGSALHDPTILFALAEDMGAVYELENVCRRKALENSGVLPPGAKLFINTHPSSLNDPNFTPGAVISLLEQNGLTPEQLVLEFTERHSVKDMPLFLKTIEVFRSEGFQVCIDDVGGGHSTLRYVTQARPDFVKVDISLIGGIDANPYNRVMVETMAFATRKIASRLIAVGVETETEFSSVVSMGADGAQGKYLGQPERIRKSTRVHVPAKAVVTKENVETLKCSSPVVGLARPTLLVDPDATVRNVKELLAEHPPQSSVVVVDRGAPVGLLMQYTMDRHLSTQFGMSLYYKRDVARIMDTAPLVVDGATPVEDVAKSAMAREQTKIYDDIVVTGEDGVCGVVSVQRMIDTLTEIQVELAKGASPLTGLPGNVAIEQEIERRAALKTPSSLIYVDLDNFKVYNDVFGFDRGDRIILMTAEILDKCVSRYCDGVGFVGHVGGDDFVAIVPPDAAHHVCVHTRRTFADRTPGLYREEDVERGYIVGKGRDGKPGRYPLTSLSIAILDCDFTVPFSMDLLSMRVAEVKKKAKAMEGNSCVREPFSSVGRA